MKYPPRAPADLWLKIKPLARELRTQPTPAEDYLWQHLRRKQIEGLRFRRQHVFDRFVVDFYCPAACLVIEVDGGIHEQQRDYDALRTEYLECLGLHVIRFTNQQVLEDIEDVLARIAEETSPPNPLSTS